MRQTFYAVLLGLALLLAACGGQGGTGGGNGGGNGGGGGVMSQGQFNQAFNPHLQSQQQAFQQLSQDPAFQALFQMSGYGSMGGLSVQGFSPQELLGFLRSLGLMPLDHSSGNGLPRGGYDYTDPQNPTYTPTSPYDLGLKWSTDSGIAELLVDWDKNGTSTLWPHDRQGNSQELPQASQAEMTLGSAQVAHADFQAEWYYCQASGTHIQEPTQLNFSGSIGQTAKLNWDFSYSLTEGSSDTIESGLSLYTTGTNPTASVSYQLTLNGNLTRVNCFTEDFDVQSGSFTFTSQEDGDSFVFHINVTSIQVDHGNPTRVDLNGHVDKNGQRALTFSGYLDQDDLNGQDSCPGEHILLSFADSNPTLEQWLQANGYCQQ